MDLQILISTKNCLSQNLLKPLINQKVMSRFLVVNQGPTKIEGVFSPELKVLSMSDYGLSKSRNAAIASASGTICLIADDDCIYPQNVDEIIKKAYFDIPDADLITFQIVNSNGSPFKGNYKDKIYKHSKISVLRVSSIEITFRRESIVKSGVKFDTRFGLGASYPCGEENIFLSDCINAGLKLYYYPVPIVLHEEQSQGAILNKENLIAKGAVFARIYGLLGSIFIPIFVLKKKKELGSKLKCLNALIFLSRGFTNYFVNK